MFLNLTVTVGCVQIRPKGMTTIKYLIFCNIKSIENQFQTIRKTQLLRIESDKNVTK